MTEPQRPNETGGSAAAGREGDVVASPAACPGCGVQLDAPASIAPPHEGTSPGCWALYGDIIGREYGEWAHPPIHRLTSDAYAAQHPGIPSRQRIQSLGIHLVALHLSLERGVDLQRIGREVGRVVTDPWGFQWLEPPQAGSAMTLLDVRNAATLREHTSRVERWARSVWESWAEHHETIRRWAGR